MSTKLHAILFALLFSFAAFFATFHLTESPPVWYDEGFYVQSAANLASYGHTGLRVAPDTIEPSSKLITVGYPLIYPLAGWLKAFGVTILSARSLMVLFILGFLMASYMLVRRLYGRELALGALALLITLPTLYGNGKSVLGEVPGLLYLVLSLLSLHIALLSTVRKHFWLLLAGLSAGLCIATKPTFLLLLPAIAVGVYVSWRRLQLSGIDILVLAATVAVPLLVWLRLQFQGGDTLASIFSYYANPYQLTNLSSVVLENLLRLITGVGPLYLLAVIGIWGCSLWIRMHRKETIITVEIIALVFSLLIIAAYLRTAGWYRYLFEAQAISLLFFPHALLVVAQSTMNFISPKKIVAGSIAILTVLGAYQVRFSSFVAESYDRDKTAFLESYFATVSPTTSFFFYNVPEAAIFMRNVNYYQYIEQVSGSIGTEQLPAITEGEVDKIILGADAYANRRDAFFKLYRVVQMTHEYTILERK